MSTTLSPPSPSPHKTNDDRSRLRKVAAGTIVGTTVAGRWPWLAWTQWSMIRGRSLRPIRQCLLLPARG